MFRSIYRDIERVHEFQSEELIWASERHQPTRRRRNPEEEEAARKLRSGAEPANFPLPQTHAWAARLPAEVQPTTLLRDFGRIANLLASGWSDAALTYKYLHDLLNDRRGDRGGFPAETRCEIEVLYRFYVAGWQARAQLHFQQEYDDER